MINLLLLKLKLPIANSHKLKLLKLKPNSHIATTDKDYAENWVHKVHHK